MKRARQLGALLVATLVAAAGLVVLGQGPASAAWCSGGGVNVVVDYNSLGGGVAKGCAPSGGGKSASAIFVEAGFPLSYAQRQPGFVCRVSGKPASDPCVNASPANAYWGLFHSDGKSGKWTYANLGVGGLKVEAGGFVAFAFQDSNSTHQPDVTPVLPPKPTPTPTPPTPATSAPATPHPGGGGTAPRPGKKPAAKATRTAAAQPPASPPASLSARPSAASPSPSASTAASAAPSTSPSPSPSTSAPTPDPSPGSAQAADASAAATTTAAEAGSAGEQHSGLPVWVPVSVVVVLVAAAGTAVLWRRRGVS